jgi:hypothetical protein
MKAHPARSMSLSNAVAVIYYLLCAFMCCLEDNFDNRAVARLMIHVMKCVCLIAASQVNFRQLH